MIRYIQKFVIVLLLLAVNIALFFGEYAEAVSTIRLVVNPNTTDVYFGSTPIALTARGRGKNLTFKWELLGPGKLEGTGSAVFYVLPEELTGSSARALITVTVTDETGQEMRESVTFNILPPQTHTPASPPAPAPTPTPTLRRIRTDTLSVQDVEVEQTVSTEAEENNSFGKANPIAPTSQITGKILPQRDHDWYTFDVERQGTLELLITQVAENLDICFRLWDADARDTTGWRCPKQEGSDNEAVLNLPEAGRYYLQLADSGDNASAPELYSLQTRYHMGDDFESNNQLGKAFSITPGQEIQANILPQRDHDWYTFDVERQGTLDFLITQVPENLDICFRLWDADARDLSGWRCPKQAGSDTEAVLNLPAAGRYYLQLADSGDNASDPSPYSLQTRYHMGDDFEPNSQFGKAVPITPGQEIQANILPLRDHDWYTFDVERQGTLDLLVRPVAENLDICFRLWNADAGDLTGWRCPKREGGDNEAVLNLPEIGRYYLQLSDSGDNASAPEPYSLKTHYHAGDDFEPNSRFGKAFPISPNQELQANILPQRDHDWYTFNVERQGTMNVLITKVAENLDICFRLWNADARDMTGWRCPKREGGDTEAELNLPEAGKYYLQLADSGDNASTPELYLLTLSFTP